MNDKKLDNWQFYKAKNNHWRWRCVASNGEIIGASHEGYANKKNCLANAYRFGYRQQGSKKENVSCKTKHQLKIEQALKEIHQEDQCMEQKKRVRTNGFFEKPALYVWENLCLILKKSGIMFASVMRFAK